MKRIVPALVLAACAHRRHAPAPPDPRLTAAIVVPLGADGFGEMHAVVSVVPPDLDRDGLRDAFARIGMRHVGELEETDDGWIAPPTAGRASTVLYRTVGNRGVICRASPDADVALDLALAECRAIREEGRTFVIPFAPRANTGVMIDRVSVDALRIDPGHDALIDDPEAQVIDRGPGWTLTYRDAPELRDAYRVQLTANVGDRELSCIASAGSEGKARWGLSRCQTLRIP